MQYRFDKHLEQLLPASTSPLKILAAVSGGADSMCLLDLLHNSKLNIEVSIAHMNFHLRGDESCKDEALVREWAEEKGINLFVKSVDTTTYAKEHSLSIEMAARELRYDWFNELKGKYGFDYIAVAHHQNDNAETLILNLLRGTGITGICGMKEIDNNSKILRPLLSYSRQEIEHYAAKKGIPYRTDHTNLESEYYRNRIRNIIMPQFEQINPSAVATLNRNMRYFSQVADMANDMVQEKIAMLKRSGCNVESAFLDIVKNGIAKQYIVNALTPYLECYVSINELLGEKHYAYLLYGILSGYSFNSAQAEDFTATLQQRESKRILSETHIAVQERGFVKIYRKEILELDESLAIEDFEKEKELLFNGHTFKLLKAGKEEAATLYESLKESYPLTLMLDAGKLHFPLTIKSLEQGLKWTPFGMKGVKKVSDYLMDIKLDTLLKARVTVLFNGEPSGVSNSINENPDSIICLPGLQISNSYRVTEKSDTVLFISLV